MSKFSEGPYYTSGDMVCCTGPNGVQQELATVHATAEYGGALPQEANQALFEAAPEMAKELRWALEMLPAPLVLPNDPYAKRYTEIARMLKRLGA
jgi:hypothetical protein